MEATLPGHEPCGVASGITPPGALAIPWSGILACVVSIAMASARGALGAAAARNTVPSVCVPRPSRYHGAMRSLFRFAFRLVPGFAVAVLSCGCLFGVDHASCPPIVDYSNQCADRVALWEALGYSEDGGSALPTDCPSTAKLSRNVSPSNVGLKGFEFTGGPTESDGKCCYSTRQEVSCD